MDLVLITPSVINLKLMYYYYLCNNGFDFLFCLSRISYRVDSLVLHNNFNFCYINNGQSSVESGTLGSDYAFPSSIIDIQLDITPAHPPQELLSYLIASDA